VNTDAIVYVGYEEDELVKLALTELKTLVGAEVRALKASEPAPPKSVMLISSHGKFPSHFLRLVDMTGDKSRNIVPPTEARYARKIIALNKSALHDACVRRHGFAEALRNAHYLISGLPRPENRRKLKSRKRTGYQARRKRDESHHYQPF
jgi:hypothetical protein